MNFPLTLLLWIDIMHDWYVKLYACFEKTVSNSNLCLSDLKPPALMCFVRE